MPSIFDQDLPRNEANFAALSPLSFIERTAEVYPQRLAVVHGELRRNWAELFGRCRQLASALSQHGIGKGDTVAVMLPNTARPRSSSLTRNLPASCNKHWRCVSPPRRCW